MTRREQERRTRGRRGTPRRHAELFHILTRKRKDLQRLIGEQMEHGLHGESAVAMSTRGDEGEAAALALTAAVESDAMDRRVRMVKQVDLALRRLTEGAYGFCADCGEEIGVERLRSLPFALRCRHCQEVWEAAEGRSTGARPLAGGTLPLEVQREVTMRPRDLLEGLGVGGFE
ncbi:MAG: TraR/DksA family transcriptional regulator [candidate division NC10 bacterium]|nr:TraR/DksA family transcriptional regulator [candidate division NC10 bacterium]